MISRHDVNCGIAILLLFGGLFFFCEIFFRYFFFRFPGFWQLASFGFWLLSAFTPPPALFFDFSQCGIFSSFNSRTITSTAEQHQQHQLIGKQ